MSITSATPATLPPRSSGLWNLPVLWKTRAIRSASTDAFQKARFPQHLGSSFSGRGEKSAGLGCRIGVRVPIRGPWFW